jgi:hypothetical protein
MLAALLFASTLGSADPALLRQALARVATAQLKQFDPAWTPEQRDCAGFVRFVYRTTFKELEPVRLEQPLWRDAKGRPTDFADAENLLAGNFAPLGRGPEARAQLQTGDLVAFRQGEPGAEVFHLMLVIRDADPAHGAYVLYHPGEPGAALRGGTLDSLSKDAPREWRPLPENPAFLGFYRLKEWAHGSH